MAKSINFLLAKKGRLQYTINVEVCTKLSDCGQDRRVS